MSKVLRYTTVHGNKTVKTITRAEPAGIGGLRIHTIDTDGTSRDLRNDGTVNSFQGRRLGYNWQLVDRANLRDLRSPND